MCFFYGICMEYNEKKMKIKIYREWTLFCFFIYYTKIKGIYPFSTERDERNWILDENACKVSTEIHNLMKIII